MPLPALAVSSCTSNVGRRLPSRGTASTSGTCCTAPARSAGHDSARAATCLASSAWLPHTRIRAALQFIHALDGGAGRDAAACGRGRGLCIRALLPGQMERLWAHVRWRSSAYEECRETRKRNMPTVGAIMVHLAASLRSRDAFVGNVSARCVVSRGGSRVSPPLTASAPPLLPAGELGAVGCPVRSHCVPEGSRAARDAGTRSSPAGRRFGWAQEASSHAVRTRPRPRRTWPGRPRPRLYTRHAPLAALRHRSQYALVRACSFRVCAIRCKMQVNLDLLLRKLMADVAGA